MHLQGYPLIGLFYLTLQLQSLNQRWDHFSIVEWRKFTTIFRSVTLPASARIEDIILSFDYFIDASGNPTIIIYSVPEIICTSTFTRQPSKYTIPVHENLKVNWNNLHFNMFSILMRPFHYVFKSKKRGKVSQVTNNFITTTYE